MDSSRCLRQQKPGSRKTGSNILAKITITMLIYFLLLNAPNTANGIGYTQDWLRGDEVGDRDQAHVHEGLRLADRTGWVGVGGTISEQTARKVMYNKVYVGGYHNVATKNNNYS